MTNHPDRVNHPVAVQSPTMLHVDTVSKVSVISHSNHSNDDAKNDAVLEWQNKKHNQSDSGFCRVMRFTGGKEMADFSRYFDDNHRKFLPFYHFYNHFIA